MFGVIVFVAGAVGATGPILDALGVTILVARVVQSVTHIAFVQTARAVSVRFTFFSVQLVAMLVMAIMVISRA